MPWVVVALAVVMLVTIIAKCISIYLKLKRNRTYVKHSGEIEQTIAIRGEYFVLGCGVEYSVGESGQLAAGEYILRGDGYDSFQLIVNGESRDFNGDSSVALCDGDVVSAPACDVLIKPVTNKE